jgi:peptide methionine sulfoxide reductase MsrB
MDQIGVSGGVVSFVCQATGDPKPQVFWNKKGKKVNSQRIEVRTQTCQSLTGGQFYTGPEHVTLINGSYFT